MFIGITGTHCSGKHTVVEYLVKKHGFLFVSLQSKYTQPLPHEVVLFSTLDEMQVHVTERWRDNFVTCDVDGDGLWLLKLIYVYRKRPFFLMVSVEAPLHMRYRRYTERKGPPLSLEEFVYQDDCLVFTPSNNATPLYRLMSHADLAVTNTYASLDALSSHLDTLDLTNKERLRPSWDTYFMHLSDLAARRSNCMKRRVGCILVKNYRVIATGYNGTPRGLRNCNEGGCDRCNEASSCGTQLDRCWCMHAEENALLEVGRRRVDDCEGMILYCNTCPCLGCAIKIVQQGVREVVYSKSYGMDSMTARILKEAGIQLRQHSPPSMRLEMQVDMTALDPTMSPLEWKEPC
ncbi:cytidine deaminase-like protein [Spinellus fusiger]|nr:cytidine deaminase-like protein [Spinellus fusiger]